MNNTLAAAFAALIAIATPAVAADDAAFRRDFGAFLNAGMKRYPTLPAVAVAVVRHDAPIIVTARGMADRTMGRAAGADTRFYIASSTKSFVALALVRLAKKGAIDLDSTLAELAPDIAFATGVQADKVTLRHLLSHSHGLSGDALQFRLAYSGAWDEATLWRLLGGLTPNAKAPLGSFAYSNLGYNVAALLVERRLKRPWQAIVEQEVIAPLRLRDTAARGLAKPADRALPYDGLTPLYLRKTDRTMQSAGGMESSARDMARWLSANLAAERGGKGGLAAALRTTHAQFVATSDDFGPFNRTGHGFGWYRGPWHGEILLHSFGGFAGFRAHASFLPTRDLGVAALSNDDGAGYWLVDIAAAYAYDWYRDGAAAAQAAAETRLKALDTRLAEAAAKVKPAAAPQFSLAATAYAGRFCNADWGTVTVTARTTGLDLTMGALHAAATGDAPDTVRAELIPGQRLKFAFAVESEKVAALTALGSRFARC
ncbi:serine hydrolase domain-containing protein [Sphingoaurantiacus capsulatus]|uniref:Serine hydrolase domain-containing protein n=1 Tax=Sphingoaurantiacus capsulatus TaxID=1771310 RepID=A0ABV7X8S4_9SPHN